MDLLILFATALVCCSIGFYKYVYFISVGYGFAIFGEGLVMMILFKDHMTVWAVVPCLILCCYGLRLSGYLLYRELRSASYRKHMVTEIKDGSGMPLYVKGMLWIFCGILYLFMVSPVYYLIKSGPVSFSPSYALGILLMVGGITLESASDFSKNQLKKINPGRFCDQGLFRIVRCPNYLGELTCWTGALILGITHLHGILPWIIVLLGYVGIVFVMFSGARRLEVRQNKNYGKDPEYQYYKTHVPILLPFVPLYSVEKYKFLVL